MFIGKYNKSIIVTYIGVAAAVIGSYFAFINQVRYSMICLILAGICDLFDGVIARRCKRDEEEIAFGIQIDSLADMINFTLLPICIFYAMGLTKWYHIGIFIFYCLSGITRLGYFNISANEKEDESFTYYRGLPITYVALILPLAWLLSFILDKQIFNIIYTGIIIIISFLFILDIKVSKPKGIFYVLFPLIAIGLIVFLLFAGV